MTDTVGSMTDGIFRTGGAVVDTVRDTPVVGDALDFVTHATGEVVDAVLPQSLEKALDNMKHRPRVVVGALKNVESVAHDADACIDRFIDAAGVLMPILDAKADALSVGFVRDFSVGVGGKNGREITYIRATADRPARLRIVELDGVVARAGINIGVSPFARSTYGDADAIAQTESRQSLNVGGVGRHIAMFRTTGPGPSATGWMSNFSVGLTASYLPLIADQSVVGLSQDEINIMELTDAQVERLERCLEAADDHPTWRGLVT